jgi:hypothetical protein
MLAQNFKTAAELQISDAELESLIKVLGMLERQELVHVLPNEEARVKNGFCIRTVCIQTDCGTVACIMGWARLVSNNKSLFDARPPAALNLFQMDNSYYKPDVSIEQAAWAIRNYLTHGEARWDEVMAA